MKGKLTVMLGLVCCISLAAWTGVSHADENETMKGSPKGSAMDEEMKGSPKESAGDAKPKVTLAFATIQGTQEGSTINGEVSLTETDDGLMVVGVVFNVPDAGKHGFHIHEHGSCEDGGKAAGGHFNPNGTDHGFLLKDGTQGAHIGDMGNITVDENGEGVMTVFLPGVTLTGGENSVANRAVILHAKEDDFGQPTGNAGARIGCGTIALGSKAQ